MNLKCRNLEIRGVEIENINDKWLKIHMTSHKIVKLEDEKEINKLRKRNQQTLRSINKLKNSGGR